MNMAIPSHSAVDFEQVGYSAVRSAMNAVLDACERKLRTADRELADEVLESDPLSDVLGASPVPQDELLLDTALYSRPGDGWTRAGRKRAIDRLAPKAATKGDILQGAIAARLPSAYFSIFQIESAAAGGPVAMRDMVDGGRLVRVMDIGLSSTAKQGQIVAMRLLDIGPWHVGFGIVLPLRKSEAAAILIALAHPGDLAEKRDSLHELVYTCRLHGSDLVLSAMTPLISALAEFVDTSEDDISDLLAKVASMLTGTE